MANALTGWEPRTTKPLPFPELEEERDRAEQVKQETIPTVLVILGNPPYNGFAGMAVDEERELSEAYRTTKRRDRAAARRGQGLNDLYVRPVSFAWRNDASSRRQAGAWCASSPTTPGSTGCPSRGCESALPWSVRRDSVRIDCLNGDKYKTGKVAPDGSPDGPST